MSRPTNITDPPRSEKQAIELGKAHGMECRSLAVPPDMFEGSLKTMGQDWQDGGCDLSMIVAGAAAASVAYRCPSEGDPQTVKLTWPNMRIGG